LNLHQQGRFGIVLEGRSVQIGDLDPMPGEFVRDEDLVGVAARQPVWSETPDLLEQTQFGGVPQRVESRPVQARS
jgi:hypothetical protein